MSSSAPERARRQNGHTVENGAIRYWSQSSLTLGDPSTGEGCARKWAYEKLFGRKPPETSQQGLGKALHHQNEVYLKTGVNIMGSLAMRGKHMVPTPGDDLLVEADLVVPLEVEIRAREIEAIDGVDAADQVRLAVPLESAPLRLLGVPVVGYADLIHGRCTNQGAPDVEEAVDPPNTVEVVDWKTTSSLKWVKSALQMSRSTQMTVYGKWVLTVMPWAEHVRLSHGVYLTKGSEPPRKVSLRVLPEVIERQWEHVESISRLLSDVAREKDVDRIPANTAACDAYNGCPHRAVCRAGAQQGLITFFGASGAARIAAAATGRTTTGTGASVTLGNKGGLLGIGAKNKQASSTEPTTEDLAAEMRRLAVEEVRIKYPDLEQGWKDVVDCGLGTPSLSGAFAKAIADLHGTVLIDGVMPGTGALSESGPLDDPAVISVIVKEVRGLSQSETAADTRPPPQVVPDQAAEVVEPAKIPVEPVAAEPVKTAPPKTRGPRRAKSVEDPSVNHDSEALKLAAKIIEEEEKTSLIEATATASPNVFFYIDATPINVAHQSYWPSVFAVLEKMNQEAGLEDVRRAPNNHDLGYGNWKYAVDLALQTTQVPPGHWTLETTGTDLCRIAVEAVTRLVPQQGGVLVRGATR